jgi:hypothetical protein
MSLGNTSMDDNTDNTDDETLDKEKEAGLKDANCVEGTTPAEASNITTPNVTKEDDEDSIGLLSEKARCWKPHTTLNWRRSIGIFPAERTFLLRLLGQSARTVWAPTLVRS